MEIALISLSFAKTLCNCKDMWKHITLHMIAVSIPTHPYCPKRFIYASLQLCGMVDFAFVMYLLLAAEVHSLNLLVGSVLPQYAETQRWDSGIPKGGNNMWLVWPWCSPLVYGNHRTAHQKSVRSAKTKKCTCLGPTGDSFLCLCTASHSFKSTGLFEAIVFPPL